MTPREARPVLAFDRTAVGPAGALVPLTPLVRRMVADNPGPMTFTGTCTYVVGHGTVAIIDPGPDLTGHIAALLEALRYETVSHILVTHTHRDHCGAARALKAATGARLVGCSPYRAFPSAEEQADAAHDPAFMPDAVMEDGAAIAAKDFAVQAIATPGHTGNHLSFALLQENALFTGDHVMAWSTSVVIPPDGVMGDYMASLAKLNRRSDAVYWPGHGGPVRDPQPYVAALVAHRHAREASILAALAEGAATLASLAATVYRDLDPALQSAARQSLRAHLEDLVARQVVRVEATGAASTYRLR